MLDWLKQYFAPQVYEDDDSNHKSRLINTILIALIGLLTIFLIIRILAPIEPLSSGNALVIGGMIVLLTGLFIATRRRYLTTGIHGLITVLWLGVTFLAWNADGIKDSAFLAYFVVVLIAGLLSGWRFSLFVIGLTIAAGWGFVYAESFGVITVMDHDSSANLMTDYSFIMGLIGVIMYLLISNLQNALIDVRQKNKDLQNFSQKLEEQVRSRTQALETTINVSRYLTTILDQNELAAEVVNQIRTTFNYYHTQIYLYDAAEQYLVMVGGTGEAGRALLNKKHRIVHGRGLVGRAAADNNTVFVPDTKNVAQWLSNPLLPDTVAEIAVPISLGDKVLGVLDVQHNVINGLDNNDVALLEAISNQVAVALRNAILYEQSQRQAAQQTLVNEISQKIQRTVDLDSVLQVTAQELGQSLGVRRLKVQLSRQQKDNGRIQENI